MHQHHDHGMGGGAIAEEDKAICPVMRIPLSKHEAEANGLVREFAGKKYYLCCSSCIGKFEQNPEAYAGTSQEKST